MKEQIFMRDSMTEDEIRSLMAFQKRKLIHFFNDRPYSVDFLRELVESRDEKYKEDLEDEIMEYLVYIKSKIQNTLFGFMYNPNNTHAMTMNCITYLKNCKVLNRDLCDYIDTFEKYEELGLGSYERREYTLVN